MNQSKPSNEILPHNSNASIINLLKTNNHIFSDGNLKYKATHFISQKHKNKKNAFLLLIIVTTIILIYSLVLFILNLTSNFYMEYGMIISVLLLILSIVSFILVFCLQKAYCSISYLILSNVISFKFTMVNMMMNNYVARSIEERDKYYLVDTIFIVFDLIVKYVFGLILPYDFKGIIASNVSSFAFIIIIHFSTLKFEYKEKIALIIIYGIFLIIHSIYSYYYSKNKQMIYYLNVNSDLVNNANIGLLSVEFNYLNKHKNKLERERDREQFYSIKYKNSFFDNNKQYFTKNPNEIVEDLIGHCVFDTDNIIFRHCNICKSSNNNININQCSRNLNKSRDKCYNNDYDDKNSSVMIDFSAEQIKAHMIDFFSALFNNKDLFTEFKRIGSASFYSDDNSNNNIFNPVNAPRLIVDILIRVNDSVNSFDILLNDTTKHHSNNKLNQMNNEIEHYMRDARIYVPLYNEEINIIAKQLQADSNNAKFKDRLDFLVFLSQYTYSLFYKVNALFKSIYNNNCTQTTTNESIEEMPKSLLMLIMYISYIVKWSIKEKPWVVFDIKESDELNTNEFLDPNIKIIIQVIISLVNYLTFSTPKKSSETINIKIRVSKDIKDNKSYIKFSLDIFYSNLATCWSLNENLENSDSKYYSFLISLIEDKRILFTQNKEGFVILCENKDCSNRDRISIDKNAHSKSYESIRENKDKSKYNSKATMNKQMQMNKDNDDYIHKKKSQSLPLLPSKGLRVFSNNNSLNTRPKAEYRRWSSRFESFRNIQNDSHSIIKNYSDSNNATSNGYDDSNNNNISKGHDNSNDYNFNNDDNNNFHIQLYRSNEIETKIEIKSDSEFKLKPTNPNYSPGISLFPTTITKRKLGTSLISPISMRVLIISQLILPFKKEPELKQIHISQEKNGLNGLKTLLDNVYDIIIIEDNIQVISLIGLIRIIEFIKLNKLIQGFDDELMKKMVVFTDNITAMKKFINNPQIDFKKGTLCEEVAREIILGYFKTVFSIK